MKDTKSLLTLKPFVNGPREKKPKHCSTCGELATMEACFDVGEGVTMIEKYCEQCSKKMSKK